VLQHERKFNCILTSTDGSRAITGDAGGVLRARDAETGVLCHLILRGYVTEITVLAVVCSEETSGDIDQRGRGASIGRKARSLKGKPSQLLAESRSPRVGLCPPSRDESGACLLWNWPREDAVRGSLGSHSSRPCSARVVASSI
jgi:hypothetical protein